MNLGPAVGIIGTLYTAVTTVLAAFARYALVSVIIFLRLRIVELKRAKRAGDSPLMEPTKAEIGRPPKRLIFTDVHCEPDGVGLNGPALARILEERISQG